MQKTNLILSVVGTAIAWLALAPAAVGDDDYREQAGSSHYQQFDNAQERREAQRDLTEDYRDDLADVFDNVSDADISDILDVFLRN